MNKRKQKQFEKYMEKQRGILTGHIDRFVLRVLNKYWELQGDDEKTKI